MTTKRKTFTLTRKQEAAVLGLADALHKVTDEIFGKPTLLSGDEWDTPTLGWDGPFEWTMITGGSSVFAGETGCYSTPTEPEIADALARIAKAGIFLEPINAGQLGCYKG